MDHFSKGIRLRTKLLVIAGIVYAMLAAGTLISLYNESEVMTFVDKSNTYVKWAVQGALALRAAHRVGGGMLRRDSGGDAFQRQSDAAEGPPQPAVEIEKSQVQAAGCLYQYTLGSGAGSSPLISGFQER